MRGFAGVFLNVSGFLYVMLATNAMVSLTCAPVWILAVLTDLRQSWVALSLVAILVAPALWGANAVIRGYSMDGSTTAIRTYFTAWAASWKRMWPVGLGFVAFYVVVIVDLWVFVQWGFGLVALPVVAVLLALATATAMVTWVGLDALPDRKRRDVLKASVFLSVRKAGWSAVSLVVLVVEAIIIWAQPAIGLGLLIAPALFVVWSNSRRVLVDYLPASELRVMEEGE